MRPDKEYFYLYDPKADEYVTGPYSSIEALIKAKDAEYEAMEKKGTWALPRYEIHKAILRLDDSFREKYAP